ncbi:MFS transporter [Fimbriiglobus ruber]|uniref:MFS permease n=1 Tax=Fimbriiglobus ruber TaxID=1908690 RepID=A0A225DQ82_9BACT|nr:MFS transporter [Fimbriiglobus ruber]OWK41774.1 MFS permease [Fimbriiglobus ruber]
MSSQPTTSRNRLHYAWVVAGVTFLILLASAGVRSTPGVLIVPVEREFGWSRATISLAISVNLMLYGFIGPFAAALMGGLGLRRTVVISLSVVATGVMLTTLMTAPWQLVLLWGVVVGGGTGMTALVLGATVVNRWFAHRRGLVLGVLTASSATGQLVFLPLLAWIVQEEGWRSAVYLVAGVAILIIPLAAFLLRDWPSDVGLRPFGAEGEEERAPVVTNPLAEALGALRVGFRSRDFWLLAGSFFVCGASTNGLVGTHLIPACVDQGIPEVRAAGLLAAMGLFDLLGTTVSGWLSDRWDNRKLLCCYYALRGLSLIYLPFALGGASWGLTAFAIFYGLDWIATVPPTVRLTADAFGKARAGVMFGWVMAAHQLGAAAASFGAGSVRAWMGDYEKAFLTSGALCLITAAMVLQIGRTARRPTTSDSKDVEPEAALPHALPQGEPA